MRCRIFYDQGDDDIHKPGKGGADDQAEVSGREGNAAGKRGRHGTEKGEGGTEKRGF